MLVAVIDIGSNSVRLVLYEYIGSHAQPVFNEKATCQLGAELKLGGKLKSQGKQKVRQTIRRFATIIKARNPANVIALATAAIRNASDGKEFAAELSDILGYPVQILSGKEEAQYAAYGVQTATYKPEGLVVDLGGGSMELARIDKKGGVAPLFSLSTGALGLADYYSQHSREAFSQWVRDNLSTYAIKPASSLYAVGGSFRAIARHHMKLRDYPLHIIHDYQISRIELLKLEQEMLALTEKGERLAGVERKRQHAVIPAVIMLNLLMEQVEAQTLLFSSAGIREGALRLAYQEHYQQDPLLAMMKAIPGSIKEEAYVEALAKWICVMLPCLTGEKRLVKAFCHLSEIAVTVHPDYRAEYAFERMISTLGYGLTHHQQVMLALALYHRHRAKLKLRHQALLLLSETERHFAYALGQLADMAYSLSAGSAALLKHYKLVRDETSGVITLKSPGGDKTTAAAIFANCREGLEGAINALSSRDK